MFSRFGMDWRWTAFTAHALGMIAMVAGPLMIFEAWVERRGDLLALTRAPVMVRALVYLAIMIALFYFAPERSTEFIYFQF